MIYVSIGRRERGKTTLAMKMARQCERRIVLDPRGVVRNADVFIEHVRNAAELPNALKDLDNSELREIVFHPHDDDLDVAFEEFTRHVKNHVVKHPQQAVAIVIDEASFFDLKSARFQWLAKCTYRDKVHIIITAHRPVDVPTSIRSITDHWMVFHTTQEHDLKVIEQRTSIRVSTSVRQLSGRAYVHWDDAKAAYAVNEQPELWYVSLGPAGAPSPSPTLTTEIREKEWSLE